MKFDTEKEMVDLLSLKLRESSSPWRLVDIAHEWDYRTGITDVLAYSDEGSIIAFEAKLTDWRKGSHQAYRNTVFADKAYLVMPEKKAKLAAVRQGSLFERYSVGLCALDDKQIKILIESSESSPIIPWLKKKAEKFFAEVTEVNGNPSRRINR